MSNSKRILILGSLPIENVPTTFGGATILMRSLKEYLDNNYSNHDFILLNNNTSSRIKSYFSVLKQLFKKIQNSDVVFINVSSNGAFYLSPLLYVATKMYSKKVIFRIFGSNFEQIFKNKQKIFRVIAKRTFFNSNMVLVETEINKKFFIGEGVESIDILPNVRKKQINFRLKENYERRFVFISHIKIKKGVLDIMKAAEYLNKDYKIDLYGPIYDDLKPEEINNDIVSYKGVLKPNEVLQTMNSYDVVLLPTYYEEEGQPGILIEAMSIGKPIISTFWNSIEEVVTDGYNGILVPIKSPERLAKACIGFDVRNYNQMSKNALERFKYFDEVLVYEKLIEKIEEM